MSKAIPAGQAALLAKDSWRGWTVVGAAFVGLFFSVGVLVVYSFGVLASSMAVEFGWSGIERSTLFVAFGLTGTIAGPIWGAIADRIGSRRAILISSSLLAAGFFCLSQIPSSSAVAHVMFALIGLVGTGTLPATYASLVVSWFDRNRGLALGIAMVGVGAGAAAFPAIAASLTSNYGWRQTCIVYGAMVVLIALPLAGLFLKPYPSAGISHESARGASGASVAAVFLQSRTWTLALFAFVTGAVLVSSVANFVPLLQSRGESLAHAARYQSVLGLSLILGRLITGGLIDRIFAPRVMTGILLFAAGGFLVLYGASSPVAYVAAAIGIGLAIGAEVDFLAFMVSRYFDRATFTTIFALLFAGYSLGGSAGPLLYGWLAQVTGSQDPAILLFAVLIALLSAAMLTLPRYETR